MTVHPFCRLLAAANTERLRRLYRRLKGLPCRMRPPKGCVRCQSRALVTAELVGRAIGLLRRPRV